MDPMEALLAYYILFDEDDDENQLSIEERRRRDRRYPRKAVRFYEQSPFKYLFLCGDEQALLNCCGVDHKVFDELLALFQPIYDTHTYDRETGHIKKLKLSPEGVPRGVNRHLDATGCLGLVLYWYRTRGSCARTIALNFGLTSTVLYRWIKFGRRALLDGLQHHPAAKVYTPTAEEIEEYIDAIGAKYPIMKEERVWGACDGLKIKLQKSTNYLKQNQNYNGWASGTYIGAVYVFAPDSRIRMCTINCPGSWHDSTMADYGVYRKMKAIHHSHKAKVLCDSAFSLKAAPYIIKSSQSEDPKLGARGVLLNRQATSVRQFAEHGMRMIQGQFPRLKDPLQLEEFGERKVVLTLMILLYNYQTSKVGVNMILNSYMSKTKGFQSYDGEEEAALKRYKRATRFRGRSEPYHGYSHRIDKTANNVM